MIHFDAKDYWEQRLLQAFDLDGVGRRNCGLPFNKWTYRARRSVFLRIVRSVDVEFSSAACLDIGAGTGFYIDCWRELGVRSVAGIDLTDVAVYRATATHWSGTSPI